jgi:16S rRNA G966 N2-methylase RsmD
VLLIDKFETIIKLWKWLQQCEPNDILGLPKLKQGDDIRTFKLTAEETTLLGFCAGLGAAAPQFKVSRFADFDNGNSKTYKRIASNLHKIKHWEIGQGCYTEIENETATWFIDPPYQYGGEYYKENKINFIELAEWCKSRNGQTIVCENTKADWLEFKPVVKNKGTRTTKTVEAIWSNEKTAYDNVQQLLQF